MSNTEHIVDLQNDSSHLQGNARGGKKGCVTKCLGSKFKKHHGSYRRNGYDEHKNDPVKSTRYEPIAERVEAFPPIPEQQRGLKKGQLRKPTLPRGQHGRWLFTGKHFKSANLPFTHMHHHMIPWELMSDTFKPPELKLFQLCEYNLNEGINLIILPCTEQIGALIGMYTHPSNHHSYTLDLVDQLIGLKYNMTGDEERHLREEEVSQLKSRLEAWERAEWGKIADAGKAASGKHINSYKPSSLADTAPTVQS